MGDPEGVLAFWFGAPSTSEAELRRKTARWFVGGEAEDRSLRDALGGDVERALSGELDAWADSPRGRLALILLLDQVTRAISRGSPRSFAGDAAALRLALDALDRGLDADYTFEERQFLLMPLVHAEDVGALERLVGEVERHIALAPEFARAVFAAGREQSAKYLEVIRRFGRFPHRNAALGRASTEEEEAFLVEWATRAKPALARQLDAIRGSAPLGLTLPDQVVADLLATWASPGRAYHTVDHLVEVLARYGEVGREVGWGAPREVFLALAFHYAVYVPGASDNEAKSAALARAVLSGPLAGQGLDADRVSALIELTARHGGIDLETLDADAAHFVDCDMAVLGAEPEAFDAYARAIAEEYGALPVEAFRAGRRRFLEKLLAADHIYASTWGRARFEAQARANLRRALDALTIG